MSRWQGLVSCVSLAAAATTVPGAAAQAQTVAAPASSDEDPQCLRQREAAVISGEIVVCAPRGRNDDQRVNSRGEAQAAYAAATMDRGRARKPGFEPPPCKPSLLTFCPKFGSAPPRAVEVDFAKLPEAPPGSDAARSNRQEPRR